jgi:hypothetical protein
MVGIASAAIYSVLTPIAEDTGLTLGDLVRKSKLTTVLLLNPRTECRDWLYVFILRLGLLGVAAFGTAVRKAPCVSLQPVGIPSLCLRCCITNITSTQVWLQWYEPRQRTPCLPNKPTRTNMHRALWFGYHSQKRTGHGLQVKYSKAFLELPLNPCAKSL